MASLTRRVSQALPRHLSTRLANPEARSCQGRTEVARRFYRRGSNASQADREAIDAVLLTVVYHLGLRLQRSSASANLRHRPKRMMVQYIHRGKGAKDRLIPLADVTLEVPRKYWSTHRKSTLDISSAEGRGP